MADPDELTAHDRSTSPLTGDLKKTHDRALGWFSISASHFDKQRKREMVALKFIDFNEQWDPAVKAQRQGQQAVGGLPPTPPKPTITVNQLRGPAQQIANVRYCAQLGGGSLR